ncbi:hypothetical protein GOZ84_20225 [Agrobacterium vitis]|nr:hypothetical protein [Agrobacterium vitis]MVA63221.1 hypothetical protein [Agrobacterium vitis]
MSREATSAARYAPSAPDSSCCSFAWSPEMKNAAEEYLTDMHTKKPVGSHMPLTSWLRFEADSL